MLKSESAKSSTARSGIRRDPHSLRNVRLEEGISKSLKDSKPQIPAILRFYESSTFRFMRDNTTRYAWKKCILLLDFAAVCPILYIYSKCFIHGLLHAGIPNIHSKRVCWDENLDALRSHRQQVQFSINLLAGILGDDLLGDHSLLVRAGGSSARKHNVCYSRTNAILMREWRGWKHWNVSAYEIIHVSYIENTV
jgi:hypothetical protein